MHKSDLRLVLELAKAAPADADAVETPDGRRYGMRRLDPGVELSADDGEWSCVLWFPPVDDRPSALPDEVPFLPGLDTTVTVRKEKLLTQWALPDVDPAKVADAAFKRMKSKGAGGSKRRKAFESLGPPPETVGRLDDVLRGLSTALEEDGWSVEEEETREVPFPMRRIVLGRGESQREVARGAIFGLPMITMRELT
jgi:hypothetical protein